MVFLCCLSRFTFSLFLSNIVYFIVIQTNQVRGAIACYIITSQISSQSDCVVAWLELK